MLARKVFYHLSYLYCQPAKFLLRQGLSIEPKALVGSELVTLPP
jgi:hypothetical protein